MNSSENPYSPPNHDGGPAKPHKPIPTISKAYRVIAAIASVLILLFALGGYVAWAVADFYLISDQPHFQAVLWSAVGLAIIAVYWMYFAIVGHKLISRTWNLWLFVLSAFLAIPACVFVIMFFIT